MNNYTKYVGMDVHKETIAIAIAKDGRADPAYYGEIANNAEALRKMVKKLPLMGRKYHFAMRLVRAVMTYIVS